MGAVGLLAVGVQAQGVVGECESTFAGNRCLALLDRRIDEFLDPAAVQAHQVIVVLPEVDGRIGTRAVSFKGLARRCERTEVDVVRYEPEAERIAFVAQLARRWCALPPTRWR